MLSVPLLYDIRELESLKSSSELFAIRLGGEGYDDSVREDRRMTSSS